MATFSWSDTAKAAFSSCLPCLRPSSPPPSNDVHVHTNDGSHRIPRARPDELQGLLADVTDTDTDAETHSLHSNFGTSRHGRSPKPKSPKRITFFGLNLFGRPSIQLPADDPDDRDASTGSYSGSDSRRLRGENGPRTISSSTLDADAAPLDPSTIDSLSPKQLQDSTLVTGAEEEQQRQRRRERKELRRMAQALARGAVEGDQFEGFQGSGTGGYPGIPGPFQNSTVPAAPEPQNEAFGPFVGTPGQKQSDVDADADDADLGGELYARRTPSGTASGSDSRSRTSSSPDPSQQQRTHKTPSLAMASDTPRRTKRKSRSSGTTTSASLPSPGLPSHPDDRISRASVTSPRSNGFPRAGFGGVRTKSSDMGAFLARRGDA